MTSRVWMAAAGSRDVLVFERANRPRDQAGGRILEQGTFVPSEPYLFAMDPDGDILEIWFEVPTPVDPPTTRPRALRRPRTSRRRM